MSDNQLFLKSLRLNLLEILNYSSSRKNKKKLSMHDILGQLTSLYMLSSKKPTQKEINTGLKYLLDRSYCEKNPLGDIDVYSITENGKDLLQRISEGDDTAII